MRKSFYSAIATTMFMCSLLPIASRAADPAENVLGRVLIDTGRHGEAWYVNPQTRMKVSLGRPADALERLKASAISVTYGNIARLANTLGAPFEESYAKAVAGEVLAPSDLIGAAWYVDPIIGLRKKIATPEDAWQIMRAGCPASSATIDAIPSQASSAPTVVAAVVKKAIAGNMLELADGRTVVLLSVDVPVNPEMQQAAIARLNALVAGKTVLLERDWKDTDAEKRLLRFVHIGDVNVNYELVRYGFAFHAIDFPNYKYAELLIVGGIDAGRFKRGFWDRAGT